MEMYIVVTQIKKKEYAYEVCVLLVWKLRYIGSGSNHQKVCYRRCSIRQADGIHAHVC